MTEIIEGYIVATEDDSPTIYQDDGWYECMTPEERRKWANYCIQTNQRSEKVRNFFAPTILFLMVAVPFALLGLFTYLLVTYK